MHVSLLSGIAAFLLWCVTDSKLKPTHVRNANGQTSSWGILSVVFVQIVLWILVGLLAAWVVPHLPSFIESGRMAFIAFFGSAVLQWFALFMVLQYAWLLMRATARTVMFTVSSNFRERETLRALDQAISESESERRED